MHEVRREPRRFTGERRVAESDRGPTLPFGDHGDRLSARRGDRVDLCEDTVPGRRRGRTLLPRRQLAPLFRREHRKRIEGTLRILREPFGDRREEGLEMSAQARDSRIAHTRPLEARLDPKPLPGMHEERERVVRPLEAPRILEGDPEIEPLDRRVDRDRIVLEDEQRVEERHAGRHVGQTLEIDQGGVGVFVAMGLLCVERAQPGKQGLPGPGIDPNRNRVEEEPDDLLRAG